MRSFLRVALSACIIIAAGVYYYSHAKERKDDPRPAAADTDTAALLKLIRQKQQERPEGTTRAARMNHMRRINQEIVTAAEEIAAAKPDDQTATTALKAQLDALSVLKRLGDEDAAEQLSALTKKLKNDRRPAIVSFLKFDALTHKIEKLDADDADAVKGLPADFKELLRIGQPDASMANLGYQVIRLLVNADHLDEGTELGQQLTKKLADSDDQQMQEASVSIAEFTGRIMEYQGRETAAAKFYSQTAKHLLDRNAELREAVAALERGARKLALIGQPLPIQGTRVGGGKFDLSQFKGKVVLVDFWATWCGPCVGELPNVKEVYNEYHDRGFEVIGISLDNDVGELKEFLEKEHIRWPILFEDEPEQTGWDNPLVKKYEINAIPWTALIDRQGKVVTLAARGERLGKMVSELIEAKAE